MCLLRAMSAPERNPVRFSGCNSAMMVAPENDWSPLQSPESSPLESQILRGLEILVFSGLTYARGLNIYFINCKTIKRNTI